MLITTLPLILLIDCRRAPLIAGWYITLIRWWYWLRRHATDTLSLITPCRHMLIFRIAATLLIAIDDDADYWYWLRYDDVGCHATHWPAIVDIHSLYMLLADAAMLAGCQVAIDTPALLHTDIAIDILMPSDAASRFAITPLRHYCHCISWYWLAILLQPLLYITQFIITII